MKIRTAKSKSFVLPDGRDLVVRLEPPSSVFLEVGSTKSGPHEVSSLKEGLTASLEGLELRVRNKMSALLPLASDGDPLGSSLDISVDGKWLPGTANDPLIVMERQSVLMMALGGIGALGSIVLYVWRPSPFFDTFSQSEVLFVCGAQCSLSVLMLGLGVLVGRGYKSAYLAAIGLALGIGVLSIADHGRKPSTQDHITFSDYYVIALLIGLIGGAPRVFFGQSHRR